MKKEKDNGFIKRLGMVLIENRERERERERKKGRKIYIVRVRMREREIGQILNVWWLLIRNKVRIGIFYR